MTRRALPSDPLQLLRESAELQPPEGAAARISARLAGAACAGSSAANAASSLEALSSTGRPSWGALGRRFLRWSLVPLGAGVVLGAGGQALLASAPLRPPPSLPHVQAPAPAPVAPAPTAQAVSPLVEAPAASASPSAQPARSTLGDERVLLDRARRQLASNEPARALVFLEQHAQRFARGELVEEREAMRVNVLAQLGRKDEAKARGEAFLARFPHSIMGTSVRTALRAAEASN